MKWMSAIGLVGWMTLTGCRATTEPFDTGGLDADGDGVARAIDCDDEDDAVSPDTVELCNGFDDDCDGLVDEDDAADAPTWYADADADGYGGATFSERACVAPAGFVEDRSDCDDGDAASFPGAAENETPPYGSDPLCMRDADDDGFGDASPTGGAIAGQDCDDTDAGVHPNAAEVCDGVDTDCDGLPITDELDGDGDRYVTCDRDDAVDWRGDPSVAGGSDCDDAVDVAAPGVTEVCDGIDNDCDGFTDEDDAVDAAFWYLDGDGDGYGDPDVSTVACDAGSGWVSDASDCDDGEASTNPAAPERCDDLDLDNDCDGEAEEADAIDPSVWYRDADSDGWADLAASVTACDAPSATWITVSAATAGDCDDNDATVSPAGEEVCDDTDNDCDGFTDEADATDAGTWAIDLDSDGYGDGTYTLVQCEQPSGFVANTDDCDDSLAAINPAATETCNTTDDDCDGFVDEDDAVDAATWYLDYDGDGYGDPAWSAVGCEAPSGFVATDDDCDDNEPLASPGSLEVCNDGIDDNDCDLTTVCTFDASIDTSLLDAQLDGPSASALVGATVTAIGDHDGDGVVEVMVGSTGTNRAYVLATPGPASDLTTATVARWTGSDPLDEVGAAIAGGDLDGDGYSDLIIGAPGTASVALVLGPSSGNRLLSDADAFLSDALTTDSRLGGAVSVAGDTDGNGVVEMLVAAPDSAGIGRVFHLSGPVSSIDVGSCGAYSRCSEITTATTLDDYGRTVAGVGDLDADGLDELAVAAPTTDASTGVLWLLSGPLSGTTLVSTDGIQLTGDSAGDLAGTAVVGGGDLDADGYGDLVVGAPGADSGSGVVYVVMGPITGPVDLRAADVTLSGSGGAAAGSAVAAAGDLNGDGVADLAVGGPDLDTAWLVLGPVTADAALSGADVAITAPGASAFGASMAGPGDVDGDGLDDLYIGGPSYAGPAADAGAVWLLLGVGP